MVTKPEEVKDVYEEARTHSTDGLVIIEEMLIGTEISIEGFVYQGEMVVTGFAERNFLREEKYYPYFLEDGNTIPSSFSGDIIDEAKQVFRDTAKALGISEGPSKGDLIVTNEGVKVLEITSRLSPGFCTQIVPLTSGVELLEVTIRWAMGLSVTSDLLQPKFQKAMAHRYFFHPEGEIVSIEGFNDLKQQPGVEAVMALSDFKVGD
jgi:biotin carboxylase